MRLRFDYRSHDETSSIRTTEPHRPGLLRKWSKGGGALHGEKVVRPHLSG